MSRLLSASDFKRELQEIRELLDEERRLQDEEASFAGVLSIRSLEARAAALEAELAALTDVEMPGQELDVILDGQGVVGHRIDVDVMGKVLLDMQHLVSAVVAGAANFAKTTGRYPEAIRKASTLRFAGSFAGSFGMRLEAVQDQRELDGFFPLAPTINTVVDLVNTKGDGEQLHDMLLSTGERARKTFQALVSTLSTNNTSMRVVWPTVEGDREASLSVGRAKQLQSLLKEVEIDEVGHFYYGELDSADKRRGRFGFSAQTGEQFSGIVEEHVIPDLKKYFDRVCRAYIVTRTITPLSTGVKRTVYRLQELADRRAPIFQDPEGEDHG